MLEGDHIKKYKYGNACIYIHGELRRERLEKATIDFVKKAKIIKNHIAKEKYNDYEHTSRAV
jgi:hypothetical protein